MNDLCAAGLRIPASSLAFELGATRSAEAKNATVDISHPKARPSPGGGPP